MPADIPHAAAAPAPEAACIAALLAVDPVGLGGAVLRARAGPARDAWLRLLAQHLPPDLPQRRVPLHVSDERLLGGLDLPATLQAGRPVAQRGLLAEADGGLVMLAMAERLPTATAARIAAVLDTHELHAERDGLALRAPSRIGVIALDEGSADDERAPAPLADRLAFHVALDAPPAPGAPPPAWSRSDVARARERLAQVQVQVGDDLLQALCAAALALGVHSLRATQLAVRATRAVAALAGAPVADASHAALAARWVLAHRATQWPADPEAHEEPPSPPNTEAESEPPSDPQASDTPPPSDDTPPAPDPTTLDDVVLEAALAALPAGLLAQLKLGAASRPAAATQGRAGAQQAGRQRGRPQGVRRGEPRGGQRLNLIETLRAAAPWQPLRRREAGNSGASPRVRVRREDFHITRLKQRSQTTTVFVVDASGSSALHRLAEAKGAVELLLADCYVRRDHVAVIAFRGRSAELLLPPTRSLVRAKRALAGLPGGGGTPLAAGIDAAAALADAVRRRGGTPMVVLLTDGRANIARDGSAGRPQAAADALAAARQLHLAGFAALLMDTSPQPQEPARHLALALGAPYVPLPHAGAQALSLAVRNAVQAR